MQRSRQRPSDRPAGGPGAASGAAGRPPAPVLLVGAGPGDPDLLTLRAEAALGEATLVVTDPVVAHLARAFAPRAEVLTSAAGGPDRESIDRGAPVDGDALASLIGGPRAGHRVVRLYRGDPWLHPAFAVESAILAAADVEHEVVPGPVAELAPVAAAGIAVHAPGVARTVSIAPASRLPRAVDPAHTIVTVADAADDAGRVAARLARSGDPSLPAAVVVTLGGVAHTVRRGTLGELADDRGLGAGVVVVGAAASPRAVAAAADAALAAGRACGPPEGAGEDGPDRHDDGLVPSGGGRGGNDR